MLVNEYFHVVTNISNSFDVSVQNVGLSVTVAENFRNKGIFSHSQNSQRTTLIKILLHSSVFISSDLTKGRQRMSSQIQMDVGDIQMQSNSSISYYITSLAEGNIELIQKIWYQTENIQGPIISPTESNSSSIESSPIHSLASATVKKNQQRQTHNIEIEYNNDGVRKTKEDVIIIPCVVEFKFTGKFYTLSKQPLTKAYKNEDFLLRFDAEIKSPCDIDILDMFLICVS